MSREPVVPYDAHAEQSIIGFMLLHRGDADRGQRALVPSDFYMPETRAMFEAYDPQLTVEALADKARVAPAAVTEMLAAGAMPSTVDRAIRRVQDMAGRRVVITAATEAAELARDAGTDLADARGLLADALDDLAPRAAGATPPDGEAFLAGEDDPFDWLIPGLLERGERTIITAGEGAGKSVLLRQIAVTLACGIHPLFPTRKINPAKVLLIDLENSPRQIRRKIRPLRDTLGIQLTNLHIEVRSGGIDLTRRGDQQWLLGLVADVMPDLLIIGPIYRMHAGPERGDVGAENQARTVATILDRCRIISGCAVLIETHAPHASGISSHRDLRPFGSSLWLRWPEYGLGLAPDPDTPGRLRILHWRGPRDERNWPAAIERGTQLPWLGYWPNGIDREEDY